MERCPCCNARLRGAALCPRCRTDLGEALAAERSARYWLSEAFRLWRQNEMERSLDALEHSLELKTSRLALTLRDYFIDRICQDLLDLLAQKQVRAAKQRLYKVRHLISGNERLQQLNAFTDYLWIRD